MPKGQYPFIDIAVHEKVRARFAAGNAMVLLTQSLETILWVNGEGARLLGHETLYECLDRGLSRSTAAFRQIEAAARSLTNRADGLVHTFVMRTGSGFRRPLLSATIERIQLADGNPALLISAEHGDAASTLEEMAKNLLDGFEGTDSHAAALGDDGEIINATGSFARLGMSAATRQQIVDDVAQAGDRLAKHPVPTVLGRLPSAVARICDEPALYLLFTVEMPAQAHDQDRNVADEPARRSKQPDQAGNQPPARAVRRNAAKAITPSVLNMTPEDKAGVAAPETDDPGGDGDEDPAAKKIAETPAVSKIMTNVRASAANRDETSAQDNDPPFVFDPLRRPTRFVWKIDAAGSFQEISKEFAETVGPNAADVEGRRFSDVAQVFNIDPDHTITELLRKRDTWSGKSVLWPVQGTDLRVPVDLAALPTYSREREFDGFRGFGIVRPGDATSDPEQIGLALVDNSNLSLNKLSDETAIDDREADVFEPDAGQPESDAEDSVQPDTDDDAHDLQSDEPADDADASEETPALENTDTPGRRHTDKVILLEERRTRPRDGLSNVEKQAFREIAERLGGEKSDTETVPTEPQQPFGKRQSPPQNNDNADAIDVDDVEADDGSILEPPAAAEPDNADTRPELTDAEADLPPDDDDAYRQDQRGSVVTPVILEQLPTPIIIHDGKTIFYINEEFRQLTGYLTKMELNEAGGMPALFSNGDQDSEDVPVSSDGGMMLQGVHGEHISVRAKLRSVGWESGHALMLALEMLPQSADEQSDAQSDPVVADTDDAAELEPLPYAALQVEVDELRSILETATDGVVLIGADGIIRSMNNSASALFDYDENETTGKPFAMLFAHESQRAVKDYLSGLTGNGVASVLNDGRDQRIAASRPAQTALNAAEPRSRAGTP